MIECLQRKIPDTHRGRHSPADDPFGADADDERGVAEAVPGPYIGDFGNPQSVGCAGLELAVDQVSGPSPMVVVNTGSPRCTPRRPTKAVGKLAVEDFSESVKIAAGATRPSV
jgi:hypothetical protein